jgi:hypothetical protein
MIFHSVKCYKSGVHNHEFQCSLSVYKCNIFLTILSPWCVNGTDHTIMLREYKTREWERQKYFSKSENMSCHEVSWSTARLMKWVIIHLFMISWVPVLMAVLLVKMADYVRKGSNIVKENNMLKRIRYYSYSSYRVFSETKLQFCLPVIHTTYYAANITVFNVSEFSILLRLTIM